jgi:hypothetical protein
LVCCCIKDAPPEVELLVQDSFHCRFRDYSHWTAPMATALPPPTQSTTNFLEREKGCEMAERKIHHGGRDRTSPAVELTDRPVSAAMATGSALRLSLLAVFLQQELERAPATKLVYLAAGDAARIDQDLDAQRGDDGEEKRSCGG